MSKIAGRDDASGLRVLLSQQTISRRGLLLSSLTGAASLAFTGGSRYAMAADSSLRSLTYSGQRWGMVQEDSPKRQASKSRLSPSRSRRVTPASSTLSAWARASTM
jgi:hypothetical protein